MILQSLVALARREQLVKHPAYAEGKLHGVLVVDDGGKLLSFVPLLDDKGKPKVELLPRPPKRTVAIDPTFAWDNAKYVLGRGEFHNEKAGKRAVECREAFAAKIREAAVITGDSGLAAVAAFFDRIDENLERLDEFAPGMKWTGSENLAFQRHADAPLRIYESQAVRDFLEGGRTESAPARCLVTGTLAAPARLHGSIKRVPEAQTSGAALVSFNAPAFGSHGLAQGSNAPVSEDAATAYVAALNWLLAENADRPYRYGVRISADSVLLFWTRDAHPDVDGFAMLLGPRGEDAVRAAEAPWRGLAPSELDETAFYTLVIGGNAARVVIRDWFQSTMSAVKASLRRYFDDIAIGNKEEPLPIVRLVEALRPPGKEGRLPSETATRIFLAALRGTPFPRELLRTALVRYRVGEQSPVQARARCAMIKAVLRRLPASSAPWAKEVSVSLDENSTQVPYLLGRLFAVMERLQGTALPGINSTIRDLYFGAASMTPVVVFPRLVRLSLHHAAKAEGKGVKFEKTKSNIMAALPSSGFPARLSLEEQGLFAIGYYHQREDFFKGKDAEHHE